MSNLSETSNRPGFQGSETSGAKVVFYPQKGDPIVVNSAQVSFDGRSNRDKKPSLLGVNTNKAMGAASGTWDITLKEGKHSVGDSFFNKITDDDWVDISFTRHGREWHTMRGLVDTVRRVRNVSGTGATSTIFSVVGRDFGKIWEVTPIWFNPYSDNHLKGAASTQVFGIPEIIGSPLIGVQGFLLKFYKLLQGEGTLVWRILKGMPNTKEDFIQSITFPEDLYSEDFPIKGINQNFLMPGGMLWQLAKEWSDPTFNELFVDIVPINGTQTLARGLPVTDTEMRVTLRNRPFPTAWAGRNSDYFNEQKIPLNLVHREQLVNDDIGRGGLERYNLFEAVPLMQQELQKELGAVLVMPLLHLGDISRHGIRRFDASTKYISTDGRDLVLGSRRRERVRDWYCLNQYLLSGTLNLAIGRPDIRIGSRIRIPGKQGPAADETYYVETVGHSWQFGGSTKSTFGVTRGWIGTDAEYLTALNDMAIEYTEAQPLPSTAPSPAPAFEVV